MAIQPIVQDDGDDQNDRAERFRQIRHFQTLRWAHLSTYLAGIVWFLDAYFRKESALSENHTMSGIIGLTLAILGGFLGYRIHTFSSVIRHDLGKIGTKLPWRGQVEEWFVYLLSGLMLIFSILLLFDVIKYIQ